MPRAARHDRGQSPHRHPDRGRAPLARWNREKKIAKPARKAVTVAPGPRGAKTTSFDEILTLIESARGRAFAAVNTELVGPYR